MKKVILLASALSGMMIWGQTSMDPNTTNDIQKVFPATPETYIMFKAGDFPVDYRTGKLNVSVPLYEIKTRYGVTIPIGLTYNTGGIKVDEMSGIAGLGWSLAIPNTISVEMHGKEDLNTEVWFPKGSPSTEFKYYDTLPADIQAKLLNVKEGVLDTQPDIYYYNLPTVSGSFIRDSNGNFRTIPYDDVKISYDNNNIDHVFKFTIVDPKGVIYTFGPGNMNHTESYNIVSSETYHSSFVLTKIKFPNNEEVGFKYDKAQAYSHFTKSVTDVYMDGAGSLCSNAAKKVHAKTRNDFAEVLLTEITHDGEKVNFDYTSIIQGVQGRQDLNGGTTTSALKGITSTSYGKEVKKMALEYSYFTSSGGDENYKNFRLKLNKVKNLLDNTEYSFEYNEEYKPFLGSFSQDYWGYYNGAPNLGLIPNLKYVNKDYTEGGNREVDKKYPHAYILKKIVYPTKGSSSFTYENNTVWETLLNSRVESFTLGKVTGRVEADGDGVDAVSPEFYMNDAGNPSYGVTWTNGCDNASGQVGLTDATGWFEEYNPVTGWDIIKRFGRSTIPLVVTPSMHNKDYKKRVRISVISGDRPCAASVNAYVTKTVTYEYKTNVLAGGLRIKSIDDFDGQTNYTKRIFDYSKPNDPDHQTSGNYASPLEFLKYHYSVGRPSGISNESICSNYVLSADQATSSGLTGKDAVAYEYVTEHTLGKGKKVYQFTKDRFTLNLKNPEAGWNPYLFLNKNLLNEKSFSDTGEPLQEKKYEYDRNELKNSLSVDQPQGTNSALAISTSFAFFETPGLVIRANESYPIQSGKWLLTKAITKNYLNNTLTSETNNTYSISDINKPMNLIKTETRSFDGSSAEANFQYATEQNNTEMIAANMVGIPIQTEGKENGKVISKAKIVYAKNAATNQMILPVATQKFDKDNPLSAKNTIDYNQYDIYGNILQYTTKGSTPTAIIWGYNNTFPIAKVEGATYQQAITLAADIVTQSNGETDAVKEELLMEALDIYQNQSALKNFIITTYTYDPVVGVTSITPPTGIREFYQYDAAGRLESVLDANGNIVKEQKYNYKN